MAALLDKFKSKKSRVTEKKEMRCTCGEELMTIPGEKKDLYFCSACNRLLYFLESEMEAPKIIPFSLGWLKKK